MIVRLGLISDTHGLLRPAAVEALRGCQRIIHAGDVGAIDVLDALTWLGELTAVRGNTDAGTLAALPETAVVPLEDGLLLVIHDVERLDVDPAAAGIRIVVHGHTHRPAVEERQGVWWINPGSAGPERAGLPVTVAVVTVTGTDVRAEILPLEEGCAR